MKRLAGITGFVLLTMLLCSCAQNNNASTAEKFLTSYYTISDLDAQSDSLNQFISDLEQLESPEEVTKEYHSLYAELMTTNGFENFVSNRYLLAIQKMAVDTGSTFSLSDIKLSKNGGAYDFSVVVTAVSDSENSIVQTGQLSFSEDGLIDNVFFENLSDLSKD